MDSYLAGVQLTDNRCWLARRSLAPPHSAWYAANNGKVFGLGSRVMFLSLAVVTSSTASSKSEGLRAFGATEKVAMT